MTAVSSSASAKTVGAVNDSGPLDGVELAKRLHEQVAINAELDAEVRYLQSELLVKNEYLEELEIEIGRLHLVAAEYSAYRSRMSHRSIDSVIVRMRRLPRLYFPMRTVGRAALVRYSRSQAQTSEVTEL